MKRMSLLGLAGAIAVMSLGFAVAASKAEGKKAPSSQPLHDVANAVWHKIKSASGPAKSTVSRVKFKVSSAQWRLNLTTSVSEEAGHDGASKPKGTARVQLMVETARDIDGVPMNWSPIEMLAEGDVPIAVARTYDNGVDADGKPKWFALFITGYAARYEAVVEDQSPAADKPAKKRKSAN